MRPTPGSESRKSRSWRCASVERLRQGAQDRLDALRLDLRDAAGPDRLLDLLVGGVADGLPGGEAAAQAQEGDVAVAVVGRLREHGQDQLVEPLAVRRRRRDAVELAQAVADPPHAGAVHARRRYATAPHDSVARAPASRGRAERVAQRGVGGVPARGLQPRQQRPEERVAGADRRRSPGRRGRAPRVAAAARERAVGPERDAPRARRPSRRSPRRRPPASLPRRSAAAPRSRWPSRAGSPPGSRAPPATAASRGGQRSSRRFGSKHSGRPSSRARSRARSVTSRSGPTSVLEANTSASLPSHRLVDAVAERAPARR